MSFKLCVDKGASACIYSHPYNIPHCTDWLREAVCSLSAVPGLGSPEVTYSNERECPAYSPVARYTALSISGNLALQSVAESEG